MKPRLLALIALGGSLAVALAVIRPASGGLPYLLSLICIWSIFAIGFDLAFGLTGLLSFGHASFFATGAYVTALLMTRLQLPFSLALVIGASAGATMAALFGMVALRLSGLYFALMTLALSQLFQIVLVVKLRTLTGGTDGLGGVPRPAALGLDFNDNAVFAVFLMCMLAVALGVAALVRSSAFGNALRAVRQNETRAEQLGLNVWRMKMAALSVSGAYAGLAGGLLGSLMSFVGPESATWTTSGDVLIMTVLGGAGTLLGPLLGVAAFELLKEVLSSYTVHWYGLLGIVFICCTLYFPGGLYGLAFGRGQRSRA
jgi:branched-chain amino acid transport system permease protein